MSDTTFAPHILDVAKRFWGEPNTRLSNGHDVRFGAHGSKSIDKSRGVWQDHERKTGGGVLDLVMQELSYSKREALDWLSKECGISVTKDKSKTPFALSNPVATYDYFDENGVLLFQVRRFEPKTFRQCAPDKNAKDGWSWSVKHVRKVLYKLPELVEAVGMDKTIYIVEGEKDVETLASHGFVATCNAGGAGKWLAEYNQFFRGANVIIAPDNDEAGEQHAVLVGGQLKDIAASVRVLRLPNLPEKGDVTDWFKSGGTFEAFLTHSAGAEPLSMAKPPSRFGAIWLKDIFNVKTRENWLIKNVLGQGDISCLFGDPGCGKSFMALDISMHIAYGKKMWNGHHVSHGGVIYIAAEGGKGLINRMKAWCIEHDVRRGEGIDKPFVLLTSSQIDLRAPEGSVAPLIQEAKAISACMPVPLRLIVIDTLSRVISGGNENSPDDMMAVITNCAKLQEELDSHVMIVHHKGKDDGRGPRGHSSLRGAMDTIIKAEKMQNGKGRWEVTKQKDGDGAVSDLFQLAPVAIGLDGDGEQQYSCVFKSEPPTTRWGSAPPTRSF